MVVLIKYELKKIFKRKSTKVSLVVILLWLLCLCIIVIKDHDYTDKSGKVINGLKSIELKKEGVTKHEGYLSKEKLTNVFNDYQNIINDSKNYQPNSKWLKNEAFAKYVDKYEILDLFREDFSYADTLNYDIIDSLHSKDIKDFYKRRDAKVKEILNKKYTHGSYSQSEKEYVCSLNKKISKPFYFNYFDGWESILRRLFQIMVMLITLVISICVAPIFALEYQTGADSVILSTRYGKNKLIIAKILAVLLCSTVVYFGLVLIVTLGMLWCYGIEGWNAAFQVISIKSVYPYSVLEVYLLGVAIGYLVILAFSSFIMLLSSKIKTPSIMVVSGLLIFVPIFIRRSKENLALNRVMNLFPGNAVNTFVNFSSYDTYAFKNIVLLAPQLITILSVIGIFIFVPIAFCNFRNHEVV
ncbi:ABC transporter permease subunit [Clostridium botulinum]|uniref:Membrane protein n=1 Tax=Clostridium botulinum TaxID=1491 RepID=A0A9Q1V128_CLOBO|nr:ABC transporter permease subunit [Clostridium botulinum]AEB75135.1 membrane protein, putative [Clostridium botulinum BKT015925]KEI05610.1 membrane protein [Clostridium botulinum C/D str. Sp77]KLU75056.1 membrane protein [Clostridium botulinum V891]KOA77195.1 membrane protein [Clostridium botulinum]KOA77844.1 membrane protein [Clostridium botulinum]